MHCGDSIINYKLINRKQTKCLFITIDLQENDELCVEIRRVSVTKENEVKLK